MIVNASPLILFGKINGLEIITKTLKEISISEKVYAEIVKEGKEVNAPEAFLIQKYIDEGKIKIIKLNKGFKEISDFFQKVYSLDEGESETIALVLMKNEEDVIIDEKNARKIAELNGIFPTGSLGVLLAAFEKNLIDEYELKELVRKISLTDFRLSAGVISEFWQMFYDLNK